jgi:hypothetical protein
MPTYQNKGKTLAVFDEHIVDLSKIDKSDVNAILQDKGMVPLSREERNYLESVHNNLALSTQMIADLISVFADDKSSKKERKEITEDAEWLISGNSNLLEIGIGEIGKGYSFYKEEIKD